ncbi:phytanoyl-CoA dioxygenase family protein [Tabrizicola oligotrophica]|uniref:Phytanoyl-CoA dioxygenase n=1 Tax=Tabrizicola oligotrophica TaxID=2710650 RepID=A0A6M0QP97_9RHOB|nr:hypothetical protein [Tabrizicola oligotrophica]NEY89106.1 hypothetical protein [Tabrizicola oligotrophica]
MTGWRKIGPDPAILRWSQAAHPLAVAALAESAEPLRCGGTWAVGLDLLPNAADGSVAGVALPWQVLGLTPQPLHRAQLSTVHPGYPQPSPDETEAAYGFRLRRDSAHLDGLLAVGPGKRRMVREPHAWILGLPLTTSPAAPLVVWEGSHRLMQAALARAFAGHAPESWGEVDITEAYQAARADVFRSCRRVELPGRPGEAVVMHRHLIHGVAPWSAAATAPPEGRIVAYFRPLMASVADWMVPAQPGDF